MKAKDARRETHPTALTEADDYRDGKISRREFLARATSLGISAGAAYGLIGATAPARATGHAQLGGALRVQMDVRELGDPRAWEWSPVGNLARGTLEYLVEYQNDGTFRGMLLEGWEISEDALRYTLRVRPGVKWNNGDEFTAEDVSRNIIGWCDKTFPSNSMAGRFATLVDPETGQARTGAVEVVDSLTVALNLPHPDISLIAGMADYPAAITHASFDPSDVLNAVGTGPFLISEWVLGARCLLTKNASFAWWGASVFGEPPLDTIEYIDYGTDPAAHLEALETGEVDMLYESVGEFVSIMDELGFEKSEVLTAATIVVRPNQLAEVEGIRPYADRRVRKALQLACDNAICLELGYGNRGVPAENHHVAPVHPEYAELPLEAPDPAAARALMAEAGMADYEHELVSVDDDWRKNTADAVAAQLRDAGFQVKRTVLPLAMYQADWNTFPYSTTNWNHRPLGVQIHALAYRSGEVWNEFGWANEDFDALLTQALGIADADARREVMREMQKLIQNDGVTIQPYWRSLFRHSRPGLVGNEMHLTFEIHPYKLGFAA